MNSGAKFACGAAALSLSVALTAIGVTHGSPAVKRPQDPVSPIRVGPNVQVSAAFPNLTYGEVTAAADPKDAKRLTACSMLQLAEKGLSNSTQCFSSFDGGKSWRATLDLTDKGPSGDPTVAYGNDGSVLAVILVAPPAVPYEYDYGTRVYRSPDGGRTWNPSASYRFIDRPFVSFDRTGGSRDGRIYVHSRGGLHNTRSERTGAIYLHHSVDGGTTFKGPAVQTGPGVGGGGGLSNSVVLSDGTVALVNGFSVPEVYPGMERLGKLSPSTAEENIELFRLMQLLPERTAEFYYSSLNFLSSSDGGETFAPAVQVDGWYADAERDGAYCQLAVDATEGPFKDRLYVVRTDLRDGRAQILLSYSKDKGRHWSSPLLISDDDAVEPGRKGPNHLSPAVAVNNKGIVAVTWYDRRESPDNLGWRVRVAASLDGGETFTPSVPVASEMQAQTKSNHWSVDGFARGGVPGGPLAIELKLDGFFQSGGHTTGLAVDADGVFHPVWIDNRTGTRQVWTAAVTVDGEAQLHGGGELAGLQDISEAVQLFFTHTAYDRKTDTITANGYLKNVSAATVIGPLKVRVVGRLTSELGVPAIVNADNGATAAGAVWDFAATLPAGGLMPKAISAPKMLRFKLSQVRPLGNGKTFRERLVNFDARVLGVNKPMGE